MLIALMSLLTLVSFVALRLSLDLHAAKLPIMLSAGYCLITLFYTYIRREPVLSTALVTTGQLLLVIFLGALMSYAAAAVPLPYRDVELYAIDQWLGLDRKQYLDWIARHDWVEEILNAAYLSIAHQTLFVTGALILVRQVERLQSFIMAVGVALTITITTASLVPAMAAGAFVDLPASGLTSFPAGHYSHVTTLEALRSGAMTAVPVTRIEALITFPSFHTVNAILFTWALWSLPFVRWAGLTLNVLMIASTPTAGLHYFVDIIGGAIVAIISIRYAKRLLPKAADGSAVVVAPVAIAARQPQTP